jgi:hypothetical protein
MKHSTTSNAARDAAHTTHPPELVQRCTAPQPWAAREQPGVQPSPSVHRLVDLHAAGGGQQRQAAGSGRQNVSERGTSGEYSPAHACPLHAVLKPQRAPSLKIAQTYCHWFLCLRPGGGLGRLWALWAQQPGKQGKGQAQEVCEEVAQGAGQRKRGPSRRHQRACCGPDRCCVTDRPPQILAAHPRQTPQS